MTPSFSCEALNDELMKLAERFSVALVTVVFDDETRSTATIMTDEKTPPDLQVADTLGVLHRDLVILTLHRAQEARAIQAKVYVQPAARRSE